MTAPIFSTTEVELRQLAQEVAARRSLDPQETAAFEAYCLEHVPPALQQDVREEVEYFLAQFTK